MELQTHNNVHLFLQTEGRMAVGDVKSGALNRCRENHFQFIEDNNDWVGHRRTRQVWKDRDFNIRIYRKDGIIMRFVVEMNGTKDLPAFNSIAFMAALDGALVRFREYLLALDRASNGKGGKA